MYAWCKEMEGGTKHTAHVTSANPWHFFWRKVRLLPKAKIDLLLNTALYAVV